MTPEAQRIAIAEACGWTHVFPGSHTSHIYGYPPIPTGRGCGDAIIPDYLVDLNAIHEAWKTVIEPDALLSLKYYQNLCGLIENNPDGTVRFGVCFFNEVTNATAAQRAEAFLRTIGKWVPST